MLRCAILCLTLAGANGLCQNFPMTFLKEIGHLEDKKTVIDLGIVRVQLVEPGIVRLQGVDKGGKPWRVFHGATGGIGWTTVWTADFDADGQRDLLIANLFPGVGSCVNGTQLLVLLFDSNGRPMPWTLGTYLPERRSDGSESSSFPYVPVVLVDANRDNHAEFVTTSCARDFSTGGFTGIAGAYEARAGRLETVKQPDLALYRKATGLQKAEPQTWRDLMPGLDAPATAFLKEIYSADFGCENMRAQAPAPPPAQKNSGKGLYAGVDARAGPCSKVPGRQMTLGDRRIADWPSGIVIDGPDGREIYSMTDWNALQRVFRYGYAVKWLEQTSDDGWLWADLHVPAQGGRVAVEFQVFQSRASTVQTTLTPQNCTEVIYRSVTQSEGTTVRQCSNGVTWARGNGGTEEQLLPDRRTVRTSHTAMQHTVTGDTRFETPPGGVSLRAVSTESEFILAQWTRKDGGSLFALHEGDGRLVASDVQIPSQLGNLIPTTGGLAFYRMSGKGSATVTEVRGRLRWHKL
jgi:hypothetical protein